MASNVNLARVLYRWAYNNPQNTAKLRQWLDDVVEHIAQGKGAHIVSASANGVFFSSVTTAMTNIEWASVLSMVLEHLDNGTAPISKLQGRFS
jgi:hypothetical protein